MLTKAPIYAVERMKAIQKAGFTKSEHLLIGKTGYAYDGYWTIGCAHYIYKIMTKGELLCEVLQLYKSRLEAHWWYWLDNYRGKKYVRLGTVVKPKNISEEDMKQLINDAEVTLIYCLSDQLIHNTMCTVSCNPSQRLKIINSGFRGNIPAEVYIADEEWIEE